MPLPPPPPPAPRAAEAQPTPQPAGEASAEAEAPTRHWDMRCDAATEEAPRTCRVTTTVLLRPQNRTLAQVLLTRQRESRSLTLIFQIAHGSWLPGGLSWQVDELPAQRLAFQTSDAAGIYAALVVPDATLTMLRQGTTLRLNFVIAARREPVSVPIPLAGFTAAAAEMFAAEAAAP
ncbi:invasion associated locus B family protein [Roseomonas sp. F4]